MEINTTQEKEIEKIMEKYPLRASFKKIIFNIDMTKTADNFVTIIPFLQFCISENKKHKETFKETFENAELMQLPFKTSQLLASSEFGKSRVRAEVNKIISNNLTLVLDLQNMITKMSREKNIDDITEY